MSEAPASIVLGGVTVVNVKTGAITEKRDVTIVDGRIAKIAPRRKTEDDANRIDASGQFLVPGFVDAHAHALGDSDPSGALKLMLANGVTGFRQMSGSAALLEARAAGKLPIAGDEPQLLALPGDILTPANAATADAAIAAIDAQQKAGADFIKIAAVTPEVFSAAQAEAKRLDMPIAGHLPAGTDPAVASQDRFTAIEHLGPGIPMLAACSKDEDALREELGNAPAITLPKVKLPFAGKIFARILKGIVLNPVQRTSPESVAQLRRAIDTFDAKKAAKLAKVFVKNGTWNTPTLIRQLTSQQCDRPWFRIDPNLKYVAAKTVREWNAAADRFAALPADARATFRDEYETQLKLVQIFDVAGVRMTTGSDATGAVWVIPGVSLHQEFDELAEAGIPNLHILQMATLNAAEFLGKDADYGTVEEGKVADLVLLGSSPLHNVEGLHDVTGVVRGGRYYSRADLDALEAEVASARSIR